MPKGSRDQSGNDLVQKTQGVRQDILANGQWQHVNLVELERSSATMPAQHVEDAWLLRCPASTRILKTFLRQLLVWIAFLLN